MHSTLHFVLYSRSYCHLCDDLLEALHAFNIDHPFTIDVVDVDADPALTELYDELVPVLMAGKNGEPPVQLCHYFLDEKKLLEFLEKNP